MANSESVGDVLARITYGNEDPNAPAPPMQIDSHGNPVLPPEEETDAQSDLMDEVLAESEALEKMDYRTEGYRQRAEGIAKKLADLADRLTGEERDAIEESINKIEEFLMVDWSIEDTEEIENPFADPAAVANALQVPQDTVGLVSMVASGDCAPCKDRANNRKRPADQYEDDTQIVEEVVEDPDNDIVYWSGVIGVEGIETGDGRIINKDALKWADLPIPLRYVEMDTGAHSGAQVVGNITDVLREGEKIKAWGTFDTGSEVGREAARKAAKKIVNGVSMDLDDVVFETEDKGDYEQTITTEARIRAATIVAIPAFVEARVDVITAEEYAKRPTASTSQTTADTDDGAGKATPTLQAGEYVEFSTTEEAAMAMLADLPPTRRPASLLSEEECIECTASADDAYNWVEEVGGLPSYIKRISKHLRKKGMNQGQAIATAVNVVKKMCTSGDLNFPGKQETNKASRAEACAAVAEWERKKVQARMNAGASVDFASAEPIEVDPSVLCLAEACDHPATTAVPSSEGDFTILYCDEHACPSTPKRLAASGTPNRTWSRKDRTMSKPRRARTSLREEFSNSRRRRRQQVLAARRGPARRAARTTFAYNPDQWRDKDNGRWIDMPPGLLKKFGDLLSDFPDSITEFLGTEDRDNPFKEAGDNLTHVSQRLAPNDPAWARDVEAALTNVEDSFDVFDEAEEAINDLPGLSRKERDSALEALATDRERMDKVAEKLNTLLDTDFSDYGIDNNFEDEEDSQFPAEAFLEEMAEPHVIEEIKRGLANGDYRWEVDPTNENAVGLRNTKTKEIEGVVWPKGERGDGQGDFVGFDENAFDKFKDSRPGKPADDEIFIPEDDYEALPHEGILNALEDISEELANDPVVPATAVGELDRDLGKNYDNPKVLGEVIGRWLDKNEKYIPSHLAEALKDYKWGLDEIGKKDSEFGPDEEVDAPDTKPAHEKPLPKSVIDDFHKLADELPFDHTIYKDSLKRILDENRDDPEGLGNALKNWRQQFGRNLARADMGAEFEELLNEVEKHGTAWHRLQKELFEEGELKTPDDYLRALYELKTSSSVGLSPEEVSAIRSKAYQRLAESFGFDFDKVNPEGETLLPNGWKLWQGYFDEPGEGTVSIRDEEGWLFAGFSFRDPESNDYRPRPTEPWDAERVKEEIGREMEALKPEKFEKLKKKLGDKEKGKGKRELAEDGTWIEERDWRTCGHGDPQEHPECDQCWKVLTDPLYALRASAGPAVPKAEWFEDPKLDGPTPLTIESDGRVYGHLAVWDTCHIGQASQCVQPPRTVTNYAYFHTGGVETDRGVIAVGHLTVDTGHAGPSLDARKTLAHYDNTGTTTADVRVGEDQYGIWFAGAVRPDATPKQVRTLRGAALSGDWRNVRGNLELVAALAVNVPGFPIPRPKGMVASGEIMSLVASGVLPADASSGVGLKDPEVKYMRRLVRKEQRSDIDAMAARLREKKNKDRIESMARRLKERKN